MKTVKKNYATFCREYGAQLDKWGAVELLETYGEDYEYLKSINPHHIWTVISEDGEWITPGWKGINAMNYIVTDKPWELAVRYEIKFW